MTTFDKQGAPWILSMALNIALFTGFAIAVSTHSFSIPDKAYSPVKLFILKQAPKKIAPAPVRKTPRKLLHKNASLAQKIILKPTAEPIDTNREPVAENLISTVQPTPEPPEAELVENNNSAAKVTPSPERKDRSPDVEPMEKLTQLPSLAHQVMPVYPETERREGVESSVLAEALIDEHGDVLQIKIIKSGGDSFDSAVKDALKDTRFNPGYINSKAVRVRIKIPFKFMLRY